MRHTLDPSSEDPATLPESNTSRWRAEEEEGEGRVIPHGSDTQELRMILELEDPDQPGPALLLMLHRGAVVAIGGDSGLCFRYPNFQMLHHYRNVVLDDYKAGDPRKFSGFPLLWGREETIDGSEFV